MTGSPLALVIQLVVPLEQLTDERKLSCWNPRRNPD